VQHRREHEPLGRQRGRGAAERPSAGGVRRPCEREDLQARRIHREPRAAAPIANGVYLDHVAFGLCLSPPPVKIRAHVGANFLGNRNLVSLDGGFTYTDATDTSPWSLELDGSLAIGDTPIGTGTLGINGAGGIDFSLKTGVDLSGVASFNAEVSGWI